MAGENKRQSRHLRWAKLFSVVDFFLVVGAFLLGVWLRFEELSIATLLGYSPGVLAGAVFLPFIFYVGGLYSERHLRGEWLATVRWLLIGFVSVTVVILAVGSLDFSSRVGRGVLLVSLPILIFFITVRHLILLRWVRRRAISYLCLVGSEDEENAVRLLRKVWGREAEFVGIVTAGGYIPRSDVTILGSAESVFGLGEQPDVEVVLVKGQYLDDPLIWGVLRRLRYEGIEILSLVDACEEAYQAVPLSLVTDAWLFRASNQSELFYIRKLKRLFDIVFALLVLLILLPVLLLGVLAVRLSSRGPIFFRQTRAGKLERPITVMKLRTMHVDSEKDGAKWATGDDPRIFPVGRLLRKFRIDEIPQLVNVLNGDISFVGPRPEQLDFIGHLDQEVPYYRERLLIQPGLTGWAQVRYPYGASVEDAARKLEYDLYYMKHMSLFFDFFILLETIKVMVCGGVRRGGDREYLNFREEMEALEGSDSAC
ncbi:MAG: exopolysaccharide biosynthesis polyprenyl glycosylphosphotransferase [Verrucomicrobiales bacterium]|nr:exopolysaccharide biosynthesis polyprenyl glycosylphosphotransferase [Verrucomicrobiales bacterium]